MYGRVDVSRYANGAKTLHDCIVQIWGGAKRRDGTLFIKETKTSAKQSRLIPFIYNEDTAYMLEVGDQYIRFFKNGAAVSAGTPAAWVTATAYVVGDLRTNGGTNYYCTTDHTSGVFATDLAAGKWYAMPADGSYEIPSPFTEALLFELDYTQGADTMFVFQETLFPRRLRRFADNNWILDEAPFTEVPFEEPGSYPAASLTPSAATPVGGTCNFTASASVFAAGDVGKFVKINGGIVKITSYTSGTAVGGTIKQELTGTTAAPQYAWSLHAPSWSVSRGYPRTGTLYEQRLIVAGSPTFPQTVWGSVTGAYLDFTMGVADDDAFAFTIASDQINPIQYIASGRALLAMTSGGEFTIFGGLEKPLAPTNIQVRQRSNYGCSRVRPVRIRDAELFVQRAGRKVRSFAYNVANDDWTAPDISVLSEHLTETTIVDMCWQQEPTSIVWLVRGDGKPVSVTYDKDQDVIGWAPHSDFSGILESVACIPYGDTDQVWLIVQRTINGSTKRYVEVFDPSVLSDCANVATSGSPATVWTGLSHLEGKEVDVVGDDAYVGRYTVASGQITIGKAVSSVVIGLPYSSVIELLPPELQTGMGSASGNTMRTSEITVRLHETTGGKINDQDIILRKFGPNSGIETPTVYSGVYRVSNLGWQRGDSDLEIRQDLPMPFHVLSVTRKLTVNDG